MLVVVEKEWSFNDDMGHGKAWQGVARRKVEWASRL
jgi:hypothetical protein